MKKTVCGIVALSNFFLIMLTFPGETLSWVCMAIGTIGWLTFRTAELQQLTDAKLLDLLPDSMILENLVASVAIAGWLEKNKDYVYNEPCLEFAPSVYSDAPEFIKCAAKRNTSGAYEVWP